MTYTKTHEAYRGRCSIFTQRNISILPMIDSIDRHEKQFPNKTKNYSSTLKYKQAKPDLMWTNAVTYWYVWKLSILK